MYMHYPDTTYNVLLIKGPMAFWKSVPYDMARGRKWTCPPRCVLDRSVYQPTKWTVANVGHLSVTHLVDTPTCDVIRGRFPKRLVRANHTTPGGMSPMSILTHG